VHCWRLTVGIAAACKKDKTDKEYEKKIRVEETGVACLTSIPGKKKNCFSNKEQRACTKRKRFQHAHKAVNGERVEGRSRGRTRYQAGEKSEKGVAERERIDLAGKTTKGSIYG